MTKEWKVAVAAIVAVVVIAGLSIALVLSKNDNGDDSKSIYSYSSEQDTKFNAAWNKVGGSMSAERARDYAKQACTRLRQGDSVESVAGDLFDIAGSTDAGYILGGSAYIYCTEQNSRIENGLNSLSGRT